MLQKINSYLNEVINLRTKLELRINDDDGEYIGCLRPITLDSINNPDIISQLTRWRSDNMDMFLTQFQASPERTLDYLKNILTSGSGQMLFLVYEDESLIGQVGFKNLTLTDAILDNGMRGERSKHPKIFVYAHKVLAQWLFSVIKINCLYGWVFTDNISGIMMNRQIGWSEWAQYPLTKEIKNGESAWVIGDEGQVSIDKKYCYKLTLKNSDFV